MISDNNVARGLSAESGVGARRALMLKEPYDHSKMHRADNQRDAGFLRRSMVRLIDSPGVGVL